jgi:hypothetical protein
MQVEIVPDDVDSAALVAQRRSSHELHERFGIAVSNDLSKDLP